MEANMVGIVVVEGLSATWDDRMSNSPNKDCDRQTGEEFADSLENRDIARSTMVFVFAMQCCVVWSIAGCRSQRGFGKIAKAKRATLTPGQHAAALSDSVLQAEVVVEK
jgi:hypothetical protein